MHWWCMHGGNKIFSLNGVGNSKKEWDTSVETIQRWKTGNTGMPIVDALMRELNSTGFIGNRGRLIVASYLTMDLQQDWRFGGYHFEEKLIDHDCQSNYGNWNASAGVSGGRPNHFNILLK